MENIERYIEMYQSQNGTYLTLFVGLSPFTNDGWNAKIIHHPTWNTYHLASGKTMSEAIHNLDQKIFEECFK